MFGYFTLYILVTLLFLFKIKNIITSKVLYFLTMLLIIIFGGFRYDVGWDYSIYESILKVYKDSGALLYDRDEYLSNLLYIISVNTNIYLFFFITSILIYYLISKTLFKFSKLYMVSFLFFLVFPLFYLNSFSVIRNFIAIAICFYGFKYILEKRPIWYLLTIIIAFLFHKSALIAVLGLIPMFLNITPFVSFLLLIITVIIRPLWVNFILSIDLGIYGTYTQLETSTDGQSAFLILALIFIAMLVYGQKFFKNDLVFNKIFLMYTIGISMFINFWGLGVFSHRLSLFFTIFSTLLLPYLIDNKYKFVIFYIMATLLYMYMIVNYYYSIENEFVPYKVIIFNK